MDQIDSDTLMYVNDYIDRSGWEINIFMKEIEKLSKLVNKQKQSEMKLNGMEVRENKGQIIVHYKSKNATAPRRTYIYMRELLDSAYGNSEDLLHCIEGFFESTADHRLKPVCAQAYVAESGARRLEKAGLYTRDPNDPYLGIYRRYRGPNTTRAL